MVSISYCLACVHVVYIVAGGTRKTLLIDTFKLNFRMILVLSFTYLFLPYTSTVVFLLNQVLILRESFLQLKKLGDQVLILPK
jgi:hypothetical protein